LEGRVEGKKLKLLSQFIITVYFLNQLVTVGQEKLTYESGAFTTFGGDFLITGLAAESNKNIFDC
jgi:hypothetical protein